MVVVDDASKDSTLSLVRDFCAKHNLEVKLLVHSENMGLSKTLNDGLKEASGDLVLILHQDCELVGDQWIGKAVRWMDRKDVAILTGYYGATAGDEISFVKKAFGVIRKQIHSRCPIPHEEVTFSEGKCDLYKRDLLLRVGGFPTRYRIAGEDLILSYTLRSMGYKIVKNYDLLVIQRFCGKAESLLGNLEKEFLFGKAMGGVFSEFRFFPFRGLCTSKYSRNRSLRRAIQLTFVLAFMAMLMTLTIFPSSILVALLLASFISRYVYAISRILSELKAIPNLSKHPFVESFVIALLDTLTDFVYTSGFAYGCVVHAVGKRL